MHFHVSFSLIYYLIYYVHRKDGIRMTSLQEQAWQSGLVLLDETAQWNRNDWPPLEGGWRYDHATVVLNHADQDNTRGQTVVVLGGYQQNQGTTNSVLVLNLAEPNKQWREGPLLNKKRYAHAAVVCNGGIYVIAGADTPGSSSLDCLERIDSNDLLQSSSTTSTSKKSHWATLTIRLSTKRWGCCAVAVHNRYIVAMGGWNRLETLSSVDIIDTSNHTVTAGPSMTVPRSWCGSAVIGHRIFVVGGGTERSVEYLDFVIDNEETKENTTTRVLSFSSTWTTHSKLVLSECRYFYTAVPVGSCLVVAGGRDNPTVELLDTHRNCVWNLPSIGRNQDGFSMVTVANQIATIGGLGDPTCATLPLMDKYTWCFCRLCEQQQPHGWRQHVREGMGIRHVNGTSCSTSTCNRKRVRTNSTRRGENETNET